MKCLIVHNYYQKPGGEDSVFESERKLLILSGHTVESFVMHNDAVKDHSKVGLVAATVWNRDVYRRLMQCLHEFKPDVVHFHNTFPLISLAALHAVKDFGAAIVLTLHNFRFICPSANLYRNGRVCEDCLDKTVKWPAVVHGCYHDSRAETAAVVTMLAAHKAIGSFDGLIDRYIALSNHSRSLFIRAGFPAAQIEVKPNFVPEPPPPDPKAQREPFVLFVGRLVPEKGISTLLDAWRALKASDLQLIVVGEGPLASKVAAAGGNVHWAGRKTRPEIYSLMQRASLLAFPSEWYEPFGLVIVEAFANGLPVMAARIGAAEELIDSGQTGFLFEPGDSTALAAAIRYAFESQDALANMGRIATQEYRMKYTPQRNLDRLLGIYRNAIDHHAVTGRTERPNGESKPALKDAKLQSIG